MTAAVPVGPAEVWTVRHWGVLVEHDDGRTQLEPAAGEAEAVAARDRLHADGVVATVVATDTDWRPA